GERAPPRLVAHHHDVGLLEIALRRGGQRAGTQQPDEPGLHAARQETAMHAMAGNPRELFQARELRIDRTPLAEPFGQGRLDALGDFLGPDGLLHRAPSPWNARLSALATAPGHTQTLRKQAFVNTAVEGSMKRIFLVAVAIAAASQPMFVSSAR